MTNLTDLTDLIEYSDIQRYVIDELKSIGCDTTMIQNPDLSNDNIVELKSLILYNITVNPRYYEESGKCNLRVAGAYLRNGFCSLDNKPDVKVNHQVFPSDELALLDYLGLSYPDDLSKYNIEETISTRLGTTFNAVDYEKDYHKYIDDVILEEYYEYCYTVAVGKQHWLRPHSEFLRNKMVIGMVYKEVPGLDEVMKEADRIYTEDGEFDEANFIQWVNYEFYLTGRASMMMDCKYTLKERNTILDFYVHTGIDLRVLDDTEVKVNEIQHKRQLLDTTFIDICKEIFTIEEMKLYRQMSNQFREDRLAQRNQKRLEQDR